jgi:hypothetical protein
MQPTAAVLAALEEHGLLLTQDRELQSVVGLVTGEALATSWWSHPKSQLIFKVLAELADHPDVLVAKLLRGKDTLVHRSCWPALMAVGCGRKPWQSRNLPADSKLLLARTNRSRTPVPATGDATKILQLRLLVVAREVHGKAGRHEVALESWQVWSERTGCRPMASLAAATRSLEEATTRLGGTTRDLPW